MREDWGEGKLSKFRQTQEQCFGHSVCRGCTIVIYLLMYKGMIYLERYCYIHFSRHYFRLREKKKLIFVGKKIVHFKEEYHSERG